MEHIDIQHQKERIARIQSGCYGTHGTFHPDDICEGCTRKIACMKEKIESCILFEQKDCREILKECPYPSRGCNARRNCLDVRANNIILQQQKDIEVAHNNPEMDAMLSIVDTVSEQIKGEIRQYYVGKDAETKRRNEDEEDYKQDILSSTPGRD